MSDIGELREARVARTAEWLHGFVARFADTEPFFDNLKPEAHARYFKEAARLLKDLALLESDAIVIKRDAEGNWPEWVHPAANQVEVLAFDGRGYSAAHFGMLVSPDEFNRVLDAVLKAQPTLADSSKAPDQVGESG